MKEVVRWFMVVVVLAVAFTIVANLISVPFLPHIPFFGFKERAMLRGGDIDFWDFLVIVILLHFAYKVIRTLVNPSSQSGRKAHKDQMRKTDYARLTDLEERMDRLDQMEQRLKNLETALGDVKRETESLTEDYRFIHRVLDERK